MTRLLAIAATMLLLALSTAQAATFASQGQAAKTDNGRTLADYNIQKE